MSLPAIIYHRWKSASWPIAAVAVLDRLIVALHRAGCSTVTLVSEGELPLPECPRSRALGIDLRHAATFAGLSGPAVLVESHFLVQPHDVRRVIENRGRLVGADGVPLPLWVVDHASALSAWPSMEENDSPVTAEGVACVVVDDATASAATRALWASLTSSADGFVDKWFNRPVGRWLARGLIHTPVSPNQVSVAAILIGLGAAGLFAWGDARAAVWGALVLQWSAIVDCIDGDLARVLFKESPLGKWLDIIGDQIVHIAVFVCIGIGLWRAELIGVSAPTTSPFLLLAVSSAVGVVISFLVVLRGLRQPSGHDSRLRKLIDATTNRDFSVLLLVLAAFGRLEWFLWLTAIGVHVFWIFAWAVQMRDHAAAASWNSQGEKRV